MEVAKHQARQKTSATVVIVFPTVYGVQVVIVHEWVRPPLRPLPPTPAQLHNPMSIFPSRRRKKAARFSQILCTRHWVLLPASNSCASHCFSLPQLPAEIEAFKDGFWSGQVFLDPGREFYRESLRLNHVFLFETSAQSPPRSIFLHFLPQ